MESDLTILSVETVGPSEGEGRERIQAGEGYRKIQAVSENKNDVTAASGDLSCSSSINPVVVSANNGNNGRETSLQLLEQHQAESSHRLEVEGSSPRCGEGCEDCIGPTLCSKTHQVSLSDLNCQTVLEFLEKKNWQICPYCLRAETENLPLHFIIGHPAINDIAGKTNQRIN